MGRGLYALFRARGIAARREPFRSRGGSGAQPSGTGTGSGSGSGGLTTLAQGIPDPAAIALDASHVYFGGGRVVGQVPLGGGAVTTLSSTQGNVTTLAVDGQRVYWVDEQDGTVTATPIGGGPLTTLASAQSTPYGIGTYGGMVYWSNVASGEVRAVPGAGGSVSVIASGQSNSVGATARSICRRFRCGAVQRCRGVGGGDARAGRGKERGFLAGLRDSAPGSARQPTNAERDHGGGRSVSPQLVESWVDSPSRSIRFPRSRPCPCPAVSFPSSFACPRCPHAL